MRALNYDTTKIKKTNITKSVVATLQADFDGVAFISISSLYGTQGYASINDVQIAKPTSPSSQTTGSNIGVCLQVPVRAGDTIKAYSGFDHTDGIVIVPYAD